MWVVYIICTVVGGLVGFFITRYFDRKSGTDLVSQAQKREGEMLDEAKKKAQEELDQAHKRAREIKEKELQARKNSEKELRKKKHDLEQMEAKLLSKIEKVDAKVDQIEKKQELLKVREDEIDKKKQEAEGLVEVQRKELERVAGLNSQEAKDQLLKRVEDELQYEISVKIKDSETRVKEASDKKAREIMATAIQRCATDHSFDPIVSVVELPSEEMKGRIIGREGRNIRAFENLTGVDVIIDDTPEAVVLSAFDPIKREIARATMEMLTLDGRIHPAKIEEMFEKAKKEVNLRIKEAGEQAMLSLGIQSIHPELVELVGKMNFRTSYGQNVLQHSIEVATLASSMAAEIGANIQLAKRAGLLHDIGKVIESDEGNHAVLGSEFAKKYQESPKVCNAIGAHHEDVPFDSVEAVLIAAADAISASRRGARRESLDAYIKRLEDLEAIARSFPGVASSFAIQAGREVRVIVNPDQVSDSIAPKLCRDIVKKIEDEMEYPGQVKVVLIREVRSVEVAH
ncbi:MAG: ribonuclease Y [Candidatus Riflebacteria bacterium]|nr:ribonuclease Y [Candidatus Riflebacteria bacterium]